MAGGLINYNPSRGKRGRGFRPMSDINVTPFVDVMLVLLIIFMVTAPLMTVGVPVDLPQTKAAQLNDSQEPLVVSLKADGKIFLQETPISKDELPARVKAIAGQNQDVRIFIRADRKLPYGEVMMVMGGLSEAGFRRIALLATQPGQK